MKTIITEQLISHNENGLPKGMLVKHATFDDAGSFIGQETYAFTVLPSTEIASLKASLAQLEADNAALQTSVSQLNSDKTQMASQVETLKSQLTGLPAIQSQLADALALVEEYRPFDDNAIKSEAFYARLTGDELFKLGVLALNDETAKGILALLSAYLSEKWKVLLDDPQVVGSLQYLAGIGALAAGRAQQISRPASRDEAYV